MIGLALPSAFLILSAASLVLAMFCTGLVAVLVNIGMGGKGAPRFGGRSFAEDLPGQQAELLYLLRGKSPHRLVNTLLITNRTLFVTAVAAGIFYIASAYIVAFTAHQ
jgi:hypothetical protein